MHKIPILLVSTLCYAAFGWIWVYKLYEHPCCCFCLWQWNRRQMPVTLAVTHALAATEAPHSFTDEVVCFRSWTFRFSFSLYFCLFVTLTEVYFFKVRVCIVSGSPGVCTAGFGVIQVTSGLTLGFRSSYWGPVKAWVWPSVLNLFGVKIMFS